MPAFSLNTDTTVSASTVINAIGAGGVGYEVDQPGGPNFTNFGNITFTLDPTKGGVEGLAVKAFSGFSWHGATVDNEGHFTVVGGAESAVYLWADSLPNTTPLMLNGGVITVTSNSDAAGVETLDEGATFHNTGQLLVSGSSFVRDLFFSGGGTITNSGLISAIGTGPNALVYGIVSNEQIEIDNDGQIVVQGPPNGSLSSIALKLEAFAHVVNHGLISAPTAITTLGEFSDGPGLHLENFGVVTGDILLRSGQDLITNSGTITGTVNLGEGDDVYDGRQGTETGLLQGGLGDDTLMGGAGFDNFQGNQGDDSESGGAGADIVVGGQGNDVQHGDDGDDVVWGNLGNDTLDGGNGADQVRGGQGDDSISGGAGNDFVSGDRGNDTESGGTGADLFHGSQDAGIDRVLDFNQGEGDRVELDPGTTYMLSQVGADTVIDMGPSAGGAPNQMILVGVQLSTLKDGWIFEG